MSKDHNSPSEEIKALYKEFCKKHEDIMLDLLSKAYGEGYNECVRRNNVNVKLAKILNLN